MSSTDSTQYAGIAQEYNDLEGELVCKAIADCTGLTVLDLGGGSGLYARKAADAGAKVVDVVDISKAMLEVGQGVEAELGPTNKIRWHVGDATKALHHLPLEPEYDVVMRNWLFDHATNEEELEAMHRNAAIYLNRNGTLINIRCTSLRSSHAVSGKYGVWITDLEDIPSGVKHEVHFAVSPPFELECTSMDASSSLSNDIGHRHGFSDLKVLNPRDTEVIRKDPAFWNDFCEDPIDAVLTATKL